MNIDFKSLKIAKNQALCENIFAIIVCICNKIPILVFQKNFFFLIVYLRKNYINNNYKIK